MTKESQFECELDEFTEADRICLRELNSNERAPQVHSRIPFSDGLELVGMRYQHECWTLTGNPNFPDGLTFDVREIKDAMADPESEVTVMRLPLTEWLYQRTLPSCDEPHILAISQDRKRIEQLGIIVQLPDGTICMIDGNHRLCARYRAGLPKMRVALIKFANIEDATFVPGSRSDIKMLPT
jgi:hypothetical protein